MCPSNIVFVRMSITTFYEFVMSKAHLRTMKKTFFLILCSVYALGYAWFYYKYVPRFFEFQVILLPLVLLVAALAAISVRLGTITLIFFIPIINSFPAFFGLKGMNPLLFLFYSYLLGIVIHQIFHPEKLEFKDSIWIPVFGAFLVISISALLTFWNYTNYFPLYDGAVHDLVVNVIGIRVGEGFRRILFESLNYLAGFIWFGLIANFMNDKRLVRKAIIVLAVSTFCSLGFGFYQYFKDPALGNLPYWIQQMRMNALFSDPNALGIFSVLAIPLFLGAAATFKKWRLFFVAIGGISLFLLFQTGSRSGFLGLVLVLLFFLCFLVKLLANYKKNKPAIFKKVLTIASLSLVSVLFGLLIFSKGSTLLKRLPESLDLVSKIRHRKNIQEFRHCYWTAALLMFRDYPLSGVGIGTFTCELPNFYKKYDIIPIESHSFYVQNPVRNIPVDTAGNFYLQIASELGFIGFFFFGWVLFIVSKKIFSSFLQFKWQQGWEFLIFGVSAGVLSFLVISFFGAHVLNFEIQLTFWLCIGFLYILLPEGRKDARLGQWKVAIVILFPVVFALSHTWNSIHSLSMEGRTLELKLIQDFGFYQKEKANGRAFRWTSKNAGINVKVTKSILAFSMLASHPGIQEKPVHVKVYLVRRLFKEKRLLDEMVIKTNAWQDFTYDLSSERGSDIMLFFSVSHTWQPFQFSGAPDLRNLGMALSRLRFIEKLAAKE